MIVYGYFDVCVSSFALVLASMINIKHVHVSGGSGPFIRLILEDTMASLVTVELDRCDAAPQDFADVVSNTIRKLRVSRCHSNLCCLWNLSPSKTWRSVVQIRLSISDLVVSNPFINLDSECMPISVTLWRHTDTHLGKIRSSIRAEM